MLVTIQTILFVVLCLPISILISVSLIANALEKTNNFGDFKASVFTFSDSGLTNANCRDNVTSSTELDSVSNPVILSHRKK